MASAPWINDSTLSMPSASTRRGRTRGSVSTAPRAARLATACRHLIGFVIISYVFYGFTIIMGKSLESSARSQRQRMEVRTDGARTDVIELGRQVTSLVSVEALDRWALSHGYFRPGPTNASHGDSNRI